MPTVHSRLDLALTTHQEVWHKIDHLVFHNFILSWSDNMLISLVAKLEKLQKSP